MCLRFRKSPSSHLSVLFALSSINCSAFIYIFQYYCRSTVLSVDTSSMYCIVRVQCFISVDFNFVLEVCIRLHVPVWPVHFLTSTVYVRVQTGNLFFFFQNQSPISRIFTFLEVSLCKQVQAFLSNKLAAKYN